MRRWLLCVVGLLVLVTIAVGQTAPTDSQTLQAILTEIRQLRHDLQATTMASERMQIALYRLQRQEEAVVRATQRASESRSQVTHFRSVKSDLMTQLQTVEDKELGQIREHMIPVLKLEIEKAAAQEQNAQEEDIEAQDQLRTEQTKLQALQDLLDQLDKSLEQTIRRSTTGN
jgi:hypothetical protein